MFTTPFSVLDAFVTADRLIISVIVVVAVTKPGLFPRILTPIPTEEIMAVSAGRKAAMVAAKDVLPARVFTDLTVPRTRCRLVPFVTEIVMVTIDLQSLLELCQLLLARA